MLHRLLALAPVVFMTVSLLTMPAAQAEDVKLPPTMTFTAYDTGTAGFNIAVAVGKMMKDKYGSDLRVLPAGNDVARLAPLRAGRAVSSAMGSGTYFAQEGVFEFGAKEWGPQALQLMLSSVDCNAGSLGVARDTGVTELKDLRGKRVGFVVGSPALNQNSLAVLAFAGLTQSDVKVVEFSSYGAMWKGLINNDVDAAFATTITGPAKEAETSPRGIIWPPLPHNDNAGWDRMQKVGSFFFRHVATCGAGISKDKPIELGNYPYPIFVVYGTQPADQVYVPVHPGAVKALKEAGQWTDDQEAHNNQLFKRQDVLAAAWAGYTKGSPPSDDKEFLAGWMKARAAALSKANLPNGFE
jgi:TRAP transporter TAXI family solute receptor